MENNNLLGGLFFLKTLFLIFLRFFPYTTRKCHCLAAGTTQTGPAIVLKYLISHTHKLDLLYIKSVPLHKYMKKKHCI